MKLCELWGMSKDKVCGNNAHTEDELKESFRYAVFSVLSAEFQRAMNNIRIGYV
jgi:hypothetical protein